ncbi:MAG: hypothetical protein NZ828_00875 [Alphaproteobacteria bacterium]|nr:hypothetical protein [Alphaproteobacteria bacterium]MCS5595785.1 hypothetical protein [Alphaproteobacteria bacterium]|tara:strand:- start:6161 stop:6445 length:285 start_codon:yes stop_codon:yes gene_type:complete
MSNERTYDDVPQHLKDKFKPRLVDAFNKAADLEARISKNDNDDISMIDMAKGMALAAKFAKIYKDWEKSGGSEEDMILIVEKAMQESKLDLDPQ